MSFVEATRSAPSRSAVSSLPFERLTTTTGPAVARRMSGSAISPMGPEPTSSTLSVRPISATLIISTATPQGSASTAASGSMSRAGTMFRAGTIIASEKPMDGPLQKPAPLLHRSTRPLRQRSQSQQKEPDSNATWSPGCTCVTPAPTARTRPQIS